MGFEKSLRNLKDWVFQRDRNTALFFLALVIIVKLPTMGLDYHWDAILYSKQALFYAQNGPFAVPEGRIAHVPLLQWVTAIPFGIFGESPFAGHFVIALFSFIGVFYAYKLGSYLKNKQVGIISAFFVLLLPVYFSISGQFLFDIPVAAATIATVYYFIKADTKKYLISASAAVFLKETGILVVGAAIIYALFKERKKVFVYASPLVLTGLWQLWISLHREVSGFLIPSSIGAVPLRFAASIYDSLFMNYTWLLLLPIVYAFYKKKKLFSGRAAILPLAILTYILFFGIVPVFILPRYFLPAGILLAVMGSVALADSTKKYKILSAVICLLFISAYFVHYGIKGVLEDPIYRGGIYHKMTTQLKNGEMTLDYIEFVESEEKALDYIFANYSGKTIAAKFPIYEPELASVESGGRLWKKNNIKVIPIEEADKADVLIQESCCLDDIDGVKSGFKEVAKFGSGGINEITVYKKIAG